MNEEELIETLKEFEEKRVEQLNEKTRNVFYAIMRIADERDLLLEKEKKILEYIDRTRKLNILNDISSIQLAPIEDIIKGSEKNE